ncbi:MAG TPA: glycosyltransferase [Candidatus Competibacteraceae bacterium]|nr:glycosyltransferase [Candidatus Competibacteraceae bacterium]HRY17048.1 glycosyltransferase [Candidatus Competibacteraceae bacterium]
MLGTGWVIRLRRLMGAIRTALARHTGLMRLLRRTGVVLHEEGWAGVRLRARLLFSVQPDPGLEQPLALGTVPADSALPAPEQVPGWRHICRPGLPPGAVLIGHPYAVLGRAEDVRTGACAFAAAHIPFALRNTFGEYGKEMAVLHRDFPLMDRIDPQAAYKANIFFLNANEMGDAFTHLGADAYAGRYNIGYWAWELSQFPEAWQGAFRDLDEIWAPSRFIQQAVADKAPCPVVWMPLAVEPVSPAPLSRAYFGLPDDRFLLLFFFDFRSFIQRKNPWAALRAFTAAFQDDALAPVSLVIKMNGMDACPEDYQAFLNSDAVRDPRVILIDRVMDGGEIKELVRLCDCFLSLHRSEGFGRGLAEAMYFGKPVIATGYSGNLDFMNEANSCLVDCTLIPVGADAYPHGAGQRWAEPDVEQAAWYLRRLVADAAYTADLGQRAAHYIRTYHSFAAAGARHRRRLEQLGLLN